MNINWSTVFFQIINFLIVVWILKKYLFRPVLYAMDKREQVIQDRLLAAENARKEADEKSKKLDLEISKLEKSKNDIMAETYRKADKEYAVLMKTFNAEMGGKRKAFEEQVMLERQAIRSSIKDIAGKTVVGTVSDALSDLASEKIEAAILDNFIFKVSKGELKKSHDLKSYYKKSGRIVVGTSFKLDKKGSDRIKNSIAEFLGEKDVNIEFKIDENLLCGIEVLCSSLLISFGMDSYVAELSENLDKALSKITKTQLDILKKDEIK